MPSRTEVVDDPSAAVPADPTAVPASITRTRSATFRVMKFGGTSVATAERLRRIADLAASALAEERVALVLSAVSGVTDLLLEGLRRAARGESGSETVGRYRALHAALAGELAPELGKERFHTLMA